MSITLTNAIYPVAAQFEALSASKAEGPVCMLNLLKFKDKAEYEDGRENNLTGLEAYGLYAQEMRQIVEQEGGRFLFSGSADQLVIGGGDFEWDVVAIVEYPSRQEFIRIATLPEVMEIGVHRQAGLEGQLLVAMSQTPELG